eukprot:NODE_15_length_42055_cov_0.634117.p14 type:complete len:276 gc:universal NODE_15_length_42055_cov_0.634117:39355-38528(-)
MVFCTYLGTNDGPALKAADVGFSMGIQGTAVAKEASDIVLLDDNFASLVKAVLWGRSVFDSIRKFLQFQLTVNISAVGITLISVIRDKNSEPILTAIPLLWVNLIMDTFAALALATDKPDVKLLNRLPYKKSEPLINNTMSKMIFGQANYQFAISIFFLESGSEIFGWVENVVLTRTLVFNVFVLLQIFNLLNSRQLENKFNIFENILENKFFVTIWVFMIGSQISLIQVPFFHPIFGTTDLTLFQWLISFCAGIGGLLIGVILRLIPDKKPLTK